MIRDAAKTNPTTALAAIMPAGMRKTARATAQAVISPARADFPALAFPDASRPRRTTIGRAAAKVESGQAPRGSYRCTHTAKHSTPRVAKVIQIVEVDSS